MKIVRDIPEQLIVENNPLLVTVLLIVMAAVFVAAGLIALLAGEVVFGLIWLGFTIPFFGLFFVLFVRRNQLILDAGAGTVTHRRKSLLKYTEVIHELDHLDRAIVESSHSSEGGSTHRMSLVLSGGMDKGLHPFTLAYTSGSGARRGADAVNRWLEALRGGQSPADIG